MISPKKLIIAAGALFVVAIFLISISANTPSPQKTADNTSPSPGGKTYLTPQQTVKDLDIFLTLNKIGDVGDGIAWEGRNTKTGTRVRVITDKNQQDKVTTIYIWAQASNTDEATNRISFSILKTVAANTAPDSISWLQEAYTTALKKPGESQEKTFGNKTVSVGYADITKQLTFREDVLR